jgi:hypothetical protein
MSFSFQASPFPLICAEHGAFVENSDFFSCHSAVAKKVTVIVINHDS